MPVNMKGTEFKKFMQSDWGHPYSYWEGAVISINGKEVSEDAVAEDIAEDGDTITITGGVIFVGLTYGSPTKDAEKFANAWLKAQKTTSFVIEVNKDQAGAVKALLMQTFGKDVAIS